MSEIAALLADPNIRDWYLIFCFAVMIIPIIVMAIWYHTNIGKTSGGRALMERQNNTRYRSRGSLWNAVKNFREAFGMMKDIKQAQHGKDTDDMHLSIYWF